MLNALPPSVYQNLLLASLNNFGVNQSPHIVAGQAEVTQIPIMEAKASNPVRQPPIL